MVNRKGAKTLFLLFVIDKKIHRKAKELKEFPQRRKTFSEILRLSAFAVQKKYEKN